MARRALFVVKRSGESESTRKQKKSVEVGHKCLPLMRLGAEIYICESETVRHKYSTRKSELEKEKDRETNAEAVLPATPPAQRTTKDSGVRNVENLPNRSKVRDSERVKNMMKVRQRLMMKSLR